MPVISTRQLQLDFEAGIGGQADSLKEYLREFAIPAQAMSGRPKKHIAADMDLSPSELTRKLSDNPNDPRNFHTDDLERYLECTRDMTPLFFLLDRYGPNTEDRLAELEAEAQRLREQLGA